MPLHVERHGCAVILTFDRPTARNAIDTVTADALDLALTDAERDPEVRALVLTGRGTAFVSGGDLKVIRDRPPQETLGLSHAMRRLLDRFEASSLFVVAAVNGHAFGGGCEVLAACDYRVASRAATFSFRHGVMGLSTGWGALGRLRGVVRRSTLTRWCMTAEIFDAEEARAHGLVDEVHADGALAFKRALELALATRATAPQAAATLKRLVHLTHRGAPDAARLEREHFDALWGEPDHAEAVAAYFERRAPAWDRDPS